MSVPTLSVCVVNVCVCVRERERERERENGAIDVHGGRDEVSVTKNTKNHQLHMEDTNKGESEIESKEKQ